MFLVNLFKWSTVADSIISYVNNLNPYILTAVLSFVLVIALIILISEFSRRKINQANISTDQSGKTMVTLKTAANQIRESLNNIQDVIDPQVKVVPRQNGIIVDIFSKLITGISVTDKTREIRENASNFASKNLGFKVLQTNYTVTGFITKKVKEVKVIKEEVPKEVTVVEEVPKEVKVVKEEVPKEVKQEEQLENKIE
jgi:hypothetical protein